MNLAYLFALSQFFMAWIIAALYVRAAAKFDKMAREVYRIEMSCVHANASRTDEHEPTPALGMFLFFVADHARDHLLGGATFAKARRHSSPRAGASPAGRTASPWRAIT